jgi:ABC-2 type transport system permease protein
MRHVSAIAGRELRSMFATPVAYVFIAVYIFFAGFFFFASFGGFLIQTQQLQAFGMTQYLERMNLNDMVIAPALYTMAVLQCFLVPLLSMRSLAEERATGSIELLLTSPVSSWEVVLGKYLAVVVLLALVGLLTAAFPALLFLYGNPELGQTASGLLALFLCSAALAGVTFFISALTRSQIVAGVVGIIVALLLLLLDAGAEQAQSEPVKAVLSYLCTTTHFLPALRGEVRLEDLTFFAVLGAASLTLCRAAIESLRLR